LAGDLRLFLTGCSIRAKEKSLKSFKRKRKKAFKSLFSFSFKAFKAFFFSSY
jgi:hypothetical protein